MKRSFSVLLAEANMVLRQKIASVLAGDESIWCVVQVSEREGLERGASRLQPDFILADWSVLRDPETVKFLRRCSPNSRIVALTDSAIAPYLDAAKRLGLDGCMEKGCVGEGIREHLSLMENNTTEPKKGEQS